MTDSPQEPTAPVTEEDIKVGMSMEAQRNYNDRIVPEMNRQLDAIFSRIGDRLLRMEQQEGKSATMKYVKQLMAEHGTTLRAGELTVAEGLIMNRLDAEKSRRTDEIRTHLIHSMRNVLNSQGPTENDLSLEDALAKAQSTADPRLTEEDFEAHRPEMESVYKRIIASERARREAEAQRVREAIESEAAQITAKANVQMDEWLDHDSDFTGNGGSTAFRLHDTERNFTEYCYWVSRINGGHPNPDHAFWQVRNQLADKTDIKGSREAVELAMPAIRGHFDELMQTEHERRSEILQDRTDKVIAEWEARLQNPSGNAEQIRRDKELYSDMAAGRVSRLLDETGIPCVRAFYDVQGERPYMEQQLYEAYSRHYERELEAARQEVGTLLSDWLHYDSDKMDDSYPNRYTLFSMVYGAEVDGNSGYQGVERVMIALKEQGLDRKYGKRVFEEIQPVVESRVMAAVEEEHTRRLEAARQEVGTLLSDWLHYDSDKMDVSYPNRYTLFSMVYGAEVDGNSGYQGVERVMIALKEQGLDRKYGKRVFEEIQPIVESRVMAAVEEEHTRRLEVARTHAQTSMADWLRPESDYIGDTSLNRQRDQTWFNFMYMHYYEHYQGDVSFAAKEKLVKELARTAHESYGRRVWSELKPEIDARLDEVIAKEVLRRQQELRTFAEERLEEWLDPNSTFTGDKSINKPQGQTFLDYLHMQTHEHYQGGKIEWAQRSALEQLARSFPRKYGKEVWNGVKDEVYALVAQKVEREHSRRQETAQPEMTYEAPTRTRAQKEAEPRKPAPERRD